MEYLLISFLAGILTVLAPCVLPVLPVIIGGSLVDRNPYRPLIITLSLGFSIILFTLLLKASTLLVDIPQSFWTWFSGLIIIFFGVITIFPDLWERLAVLLKLGNKSNKLLNKANKKKGIWGMILLGSALGPVFASCSPVYFVILATVLPANFWLGVINLVAYGLGLSFIMFWIALLGQKAVQQFRWAADPKGAFKKVLGILFLIVGFSILFGLDKKLESWTLDNSILDVTQAEQKLLKKVEK